MPGMRRGLTQDILTEIEATIPGNTVSATLAGSLAGTLDDERAGRVPAG